jgi:hypothetical protein
MIWDEKQQDRDLLAFFKDLIAFRAAHIDLINAGMLRFEVQDGIPRWFIGEGAVSLMAIYTGEKPPAPAIREGKLVFCAAPLRGDDIPPHTLAVFEYAKKS